MPLGNVNRSEIKAFTFDCYGTLIDWETGLLSVLRPWANREGLTQVDDTTLLSTFSLIEPDVQAACPDARYPDILHETMRRIAHAFTADATREDCVALAESVGNWPTFDDTPAALSRLKSRFRLIILSNVDRASFARSIRKLGVQFDTIITAEDVGSYKPNPAHFHRALDWLANERIRSDEMLHVAESLFHDHVPARALGLRSIWIKRRQEGSSRATRLPECDVAPDMTFPTLAAFADFMLGA